MCSAGGSAIVPGPQTSRSPYSSYCAPLVCVSNFPGGSALWRFYKQTNKHTNKQSIKQTNNQTNKVCRPIVAGPHLSSCQGWHCIDWSRLFFEIGFFRLCHGEPLCATCAALHILVTLGTVVQRAQSLVTQRAGA